MKWGEAFFALAASVLWAVPAIANTNAWALSSPDRRCVIAVTLEEGGTLRYEVTRSNQPVVLSSPMGLRCADETFERGITLRSAGDLETRSETYELFAGKAPRVNRVLNFRSLVFQNTKGAALMVDLAASNEGVAFRYRFAEESAKLRIVEDELTAFRVGPDAHGWLQPYHAAGPYTPAYEDFYFRVAPGDRPPRSRGDAVGWCLPALFQAATNGPWMLFTESGEPGSYCGCHLDADSQGGNYRIRFPLVDEHTQGQGIKVTTHPRGTLPWALPWRVIVLGSTAGEIATATLITDLATPSKIAETAWIRPGRASWAWWAYPDGPFNAERFNEFTDFAARMGWEYTLFDAGWWTPGLKTIAQHALTRKVQALAWLHASDFYDERKGRAKLDEMQAAGVRGVKVDFWCSDRQESLAAMGRLFAAAAEKRMIVNLHGCTMPRGWERTWPNFLTAEAVLGTESYFYEPRYSEKAAELNTVLPFTRNAVGPMDITPIACSPKKFVRTTTAAHELAAAIVATSGIVHYADKPEFFESLPAEVRRMFQEAPARWDETRCLIGEPGRIVVFARRTGRVWFVAGLNGTGESMPLELDLAPFGIASRSQLVTEGENPIMEVAVETIEKNSKLQHTMAPRGGFILRLDLE
jgi:alpha-glucosidase